MGLSCQDRLVVDQGSRTSLEPQGDLGVLELTARVVVFSFAGRPAGRAPCLLAGAGAGSALEPCRSFHLREQRQQGNGQAGAGPDPPVSMASLSPGVRRKTPRPVRS
jgi:hypothetical protein